VLKQKKLKVFKFVLYYPVDGWQPREWVTEVASLVDFPVTYTEYAKVECQKYLPNFEPEVIYHGVNKKEFYPLEAEFNKKFRNEYFGGKADGKFLITNVNRNWMRKDVPRTLEVFSKFKKLHPDSFLYLHMKNNDLFCDIMEVAKQFDLTIGEDYSMPTVDGNPNKYSELTGVPVQVLNAIYNTSDVIVSTSMGEGWGLSSTEAMATKTPVIMPNHTSFPEICGDGRGQLAETKGWVCFGRDDWNRVRPMVDSDDILKKIEYVYNNRSEAKKMADKAYEWVTTDLTWEKVCEKWKEVFLRASTEIPNIGRNDECPVCKIKYKKCIHGKNK
jgi:glycosyltransferase involved in cell wall biosynthesis